MESAELSDRPFHRNRGRSEDSSRQDSDTTTRPLPRSRPIDREAFIRHITSADGVVVAPRTTPLRHLKSPSAMRQLMQEKFFQHYFSLGTSFPGFDFMADCATSSSVMRLTLDTSYLVVVGSAFHNPQILAEARNTYSRALICFRRELSKPVVRLVAVAQLLIMCEMFAALSTDDLNWRRHADGVGLIMINCSKADVESGYIDALLKSKVRVPFALWNGLLARKQGTNVEKLYSKDFSASARIPGTATQFHALSKRVPGVLEHSDDICRLGLRADALEVASALNDIRAMEGLLHDRISRYVAGLDESPYSTARLDHFERSTLRSHIDHEQTFTHAFTFSTPERAIIQVSYWMCLLTLQQAHLNTRKHVGKGLYPFRYNRAQLERQKIAVYECADNLCMSCAYFGFPENGYLGLMAIMGPLQLASRWYKVQNDKVKFEWCRAVARGLQSSGLSAAVMGLADAPSPSEVSIAPSSERVADLEGD